MENYQNRCLYRLPLPKYKVSGTYTCGKFAAHSCGKFAANAFFVCKFLFWRTVLAHNMRRKYAAHSCRTLFWHTMWAANLQRTVVTHCTGTQCAPQVCSARLSRTILAQCAPQVCGAQLSRAILVCHKFAAHSCHALRCSGWFDMVIAKKKN